MLPCVRGSGTSPYLAAQVGDRDRVAARVVGKIIVVDAQHQSPGIRHFHRLRVRADEKRPARANAPDERTGWRIGHRIFAGQNPVPADAIHFEA